MAFDAFLKITGVKGESTDAKHTNEIQVETFGFGVSNTGSAAGGGGGAGKTTTQDFSFAGGLTSAGPQLFLACASGKHFPDAVLTVRRSGQKDVEFYRLKFSDILISSYAEAGTAATDGVPLDHVTFNFAKLEISYTRQDAKGAAGETTTVGWDVKENRQLT